MTFAEQQIVLRRYYRNRWLRRGIALLGFALGIIVGGTLMVLVGVALGVGAGLLPPGFGVAGAAVAWRLTKGLDAVSYKV